MKWRDGMLVKVKDTKRVRRINPQSIGYSFRIRTTASDWLNDGKEVAADSTNKYSMNYTADDLEIPFELYLEQIEQL